MATTNKFVPLSAAEDAELSKFIGESVRNNRIFRLASNRVGIDDKFTVQELFNASIETLQTLGTNLQKLINSKHGIDPEFGGSSDVFKVCNVDANTIVLNLKYMIRDKAIRLEKVELEKELSLKKKELEQYTTPTQKKRDLQKVIKELEAQL